MALRLSLFVLQVENFLSREFFSGIDLLSITASLLIEYLPEMEQHNIIDVCFFLFLFNTPN